MSPGVYYQTTETHPETRLQEQRLILRLLKGQMRNHEC